jgi:hypothetical protein
MAAICFGLGPGFGSIPTSRGAGTARGAALNVKNHQLLNLFRSVSNSTPHIYNATKATPVNQRIMKLAKKISVNIA